MDEYYTANEEMVTMPDTVSYVNRSAGKLTISVVSTKEGDLEKTKVLQIPEQNVICYQNNTFNGKTPIIAYILGDASGTP